MTVKWRLLNTGVRDATDNMALDRAILEVHQQGNQANTLRFLQFTPSALVGYHQSVAQEIREDYCLENNINVQRRISGGGAIYMDQQQLGWELFMDRSFFKTANMDEIARKVCEAAADGISRLGVEARYRPRNDIEVNGRKISGTGGSYDGNSLVYHGTLLLDFDVENMLRVLRIPIEKISDKMIEDARQRVVNLKELLGEIPDLNYVMQTLSDAFAEHFGIEFQQGELNDAEMSAYENARVEMETDEWIYLNNNQIDDLPVLASIYRCDGGTISVQLAFDTRKKLLKQVWFNGDFFINPRRLINDLEASLKNIYRDDIANTINSFFANNEAEMLMLGADDFIQSVEQCLAQLTETV